MIIDIKNNELIFSRIKDLTQFRNDLKELKGANVREYKRKFYIPLQHIGQVRSVIGKKYRKTISLSLSYEKFSERFVTLKGPIEIIWNPAICYIKGADIPWTEVIPATSYFHKDAKRVKAFGKSWSGYVHLFDPIKGEFPSGLLERIVTILNKNGLQYTISQTFSYPTPYLNIKPSFPFQPTQDQINSVEALYKANTGIGKLPTGFGKTSFVAASLIAKKGVRSLFMVNQKVLGDDAYRDFEAVFAGNDVKIGMIGDGVSDIGDITIASIQTISSSLKPPTSKEKYLVVHQLEMAKKRLPLLEDKEKVEETKKLIKKYQSRLKSIDKQIERNKALLPFLKSVDLFIVDEAQVLGTPQWEGFLRIRKAPYRYTLSATPVRSDGGDIQIVAATGELRYESKAAEQIEKGRLAEFLAHFKKFDHKVDKAIIKDVRMDFHQAYELFIVNNYKRNDHLCNKVISWAKDNSVLALVTRIAHGEIVRDMLISKGLSPEEVHFIHGDTPDEERRTLIEDFRSKRFPVLIGSSVFDVGFNAKNAAKMVRFNAGKSKVKEPQRAGRTVRKRDDDSIGETYDLIDINVPYFESQAWQRLRLIREEFGEERVKFHKGIIEGEMNIVAIKEIVAATPDVEEREKGERVLRLLDLEQSYDSEPALNLDSLSPDLKRFLNKINA